MITDVTRETEAETTTAFTITFTATASQFAGFVFIALLKFTMATSTATPSQSISFVFSQFPRPPPGMVGVFFFLHVKNFPILIVLGLTKLLALFWVPGC